MKKIIIFIIFVFSFGYYAHAQVNPHALGLRFGSEDINRAEISYQHGISDVNRLELDLSFGTRSHQHRMFMAGIYNRMFLAVIYHWNWNIVGGLNWYIGPGASYYNSEDYINVGIGGQTGLEYDFNQLDLPILISIDARPMWGVFGNESSLGLVASLGVRYTW